MAKKSQKRSRQSKVKKLGDLTPGTKAKNVKGGERRGEEVKVQSLSWKSANY